MSGSSHPKTSAKRQSSHGGAGKGHHHSNHTHGHIHHETKDAHARPLVIGGIVLIVVTIFAYILTWVIFFAFPSPEQGEPVNMRPLPTVLPADLPPGPLIEAKPNQNTNAVLREQITTLNSYGWVNEQEGVVHIPIEEAMDTVLEQGIAPVKTTESKPTPKP